MFLQICRIAYIYCSPTIEPMKLIRLLTCFALLVPLISNAQFTQVFSYVPTNEPWPVPLFYDPITTADMDGDGIDDVLSEFFSINYSPGAGQFSVHEFTSPSEWGARDITAADFTGNGYADIVTNTLFTEELYSAFHENDGNGDILNVSILIPTSNGNPVFVGGTNQITHADMDGDGIVDIVRTAGFGFDGEYYSNSVNVLRNVNYTGEWEFYSATSYQYYQRDVTRMVLGDLSGNGREDVLYNWRINDFNSPVELRWVENNSTPGNIVFEPTVTIRSAFRPFDVADVDGDGLNDILGYDVAGTQLSWLPNLGNGNFGAPVAINPLQNGVPTSIGNTRHLVAEDMNGDGHVDLVIDRQVISGPAPIYVLINDGTGQFSVFQEIAGAGNNARMFLADVTGNGTRELIRSNSSGIFISEWSMSCTPVAPTSLTANPVGNGMMLSWSVFPESVRCLIQAGTSFGGPFQYVNVPGYEVGEKFVPANLITPNTTYGWRVRCFCEGDPDDVAGPWSAIHYVQYNPQTALVTNMYPNPSPGEVRLAANVPEYTVRIYDLSGRMLLERFTPENDLILESGALSQGMYVVVFDHQGVFTASQLLIQE